MQHYLNDGIINEDTVCKDSSKNIFIGVFPDTGRNFESAPYFKVSWKQINATNNSVARISTINGDYVIHYNTSVELPAKIIDKINDILDSSKYIVPKYNMEDVKNGWEAILKATSIYINKPEIYEQLKLSIPKIKINPQSDTLKDCGNIIKWGK